MLYMSDVYSNWSMQTTLDNLDGINLGHLNKGSNPFSSLQMALSSKLHFGNRNRNLKDPLHKNDDDPKNNNWF